MEILCLCRKENLTNLLAEYEHEFREQGASLVCVDAGTRFDASLTELLRLCREEPLAIFHPESDFPLFPKGLTQTHIPTFCFQVDTYAYTEHRYKWACLFDHVAVFHPAYVKTFLDRGHAGTFLLPHAVRRTLYSNESLERVFDVGWVGQTYGPIYRHRENLLPRLAQEFRMNDWKSKYSTEQMADVYLRSRIVLNIGRDDYPQDANLRTFEAMAAGALLVTSLPTELTDLGFEEGCDFVGYRDENELIPLIGNYLNDEANLIRIAKAGREKVLGHHTYRDRVTFLIQRLQKAKGRFAAPGREWTEAQVKSAYLDYYSSNGALAEAVSVIPRILLGDPKSAANGSMQILRAVGRKTVGKLKKRMD